MDCTDLSPPRRALVDVALARVGWHAGMPEYRELIGPADDLAHQEEEERESDCGLVLAGEIRTAFETPDPTPYVNGQAFPRVYELAGGNPWTTGGAMRAPARDGSDPPLVADGLVWGDSPAPPGTRPAFPAHMELVVGRTDIDATRITLRVVAGGVRDAQGREIVATEEREVVFANGRWADTKTGRPLIGIIDADELGNRYPLRAAA